MIAIWLAIAPVFLLILLGYVLRRVGIPSIVFWNLNDRLVYLVLMPALFFVKIAGAKLDDAATGILALTLIGAFFAAILAALILGRFARLAPPVLTSTLQGAARFNTFIGLAIAEALYGAGALQTAVIAAALLVPVVNVTIVPLIVWSHSAGEGRILVRALRDLARNPLILSISAGLAFNLIGWGNPPVLGEMFAILGAAALPVMLLCVGANLRPRQMQAAFVPLALASGIKLGLFPVVVTGLALATGLPPDTARVALIFAALPTGVAAYTLARQMGGDAPLMATIITLQTMATFLTLPVTLIAAGWVLGF